jgi:subtilase family serine protease
MTVLVSAGDSGAAGCDSSSASTASGGHAVNGLCSSPYSTCVGGTEFSDTANPALFWSSSNTPGTDGSALGYIPEAAWNESGLVAGGSGLWAGGGGASAVYAKPSWQTGSGVPAGNYRYVPDVALTSAVHDGYLISVGGLFYVAGGTSVSAPSFAGLMALTAERRGARLGNANPVLYTLAALEARGGASVFHDVTAGNNSVPGLTGYSAGAGYDPVTGWGSVNANLLVNSWATGAALVPSFQVSAPSAAVSLAQGGTTGTTVAVSVSGGFASAVSLSANGLPAGLTAGFTPATLPSPGSGSSTLALTATAQTTPGTYQVVITATGGGNTQATFLAVNVMARCSYALSSISASVPPAAGAYGVTVTAGSGCAWTALSNASWITVTSGSSGTGSGPVSYAVSANTGAASRTGSITVAGLTFSITQAFVPCTYTVSAGAISSDASGFSGTVSVTAPPACSWTAVSNAGWITVQSGASGTGNGKVSYAVAANTGNSTRSGDLVVAGTTLEVTEAGRATAKISLAAQAATRQ